ncbi:ribosome maturation factor RimM [Sphingomicrobium lutaoense]|uniref:Ribosome maturation factor RimM n=1 Tax=Sphingomicrobium lutaoense TaxID=515949 RepID=A0A839Z4T7_9SPHN|nr:ribosome maturation factor RimM [Sphingomicrobium lutaoense]MBB3763674.1 16S rRNA processing protein RimM [Sphingomicrobium lutaoense]
MTSPAASAGRVALAAVAGAHGIKGEVRLKLFAEGVDSLKKAASLFVGGVERKPLSVRAGGKAVIARFEGVESRDAAEALRGQLIEIDRDELPPLEEGEYYFSDLIGLAVVDEDGEAIGTVRSVDNFGASDVVEIERPSGKSFMVPLIPQAVPEWDEERLVVTRDFAEE